MSERKRKLDRTRSDELRALDDEWEKKQVSQTSYYAKHAAILSGHQAVGPRKVTKDFATKQWHPEVHSGLFSFIILLKLIFGVALGSVARESRT